MRSRNCRSRRWWHRHSSLWLILLLVASTPAWSQDETPGPLHAKASDIVATGPEVPGMTSYDDLMRQLLVQYHIPGGAVAVAKDGKLMFARGYGWADVEDQRPVEPESLFRIASISKPVTAAVVLRLVEQGRLSLDDPAVKYLPELQPAEGSERDGRWDGITIRQLLQHTGGWDRDKSFDPMFIPFRAAEALGVAPPADSLTVIRYMLGQPLDFEPGTRYAYSNLGYCVLGRIIEQVTGKPYDQAARELILQPADIRHMQLGRTLLGHRAEGEVRYYYHSPDALTRSVFPGVHDQIAWPDGGFHLEAMDAHGGWIASAVDLVRFATGADGSRQPALFGESSLAATVARPDREDAAESDTYYGLGWMIRPVDDDANWWHTGSLPGTITLLVRTHHGMAWAAVFNTRPRETDKFRAALDSGLWEAASAVKQWPEHDLFATP
ncbi:MAG: serine hydrolase domain-containing protein [Pirellulales bacterium]